jgi:DNA-binding response OmpR family regulator
MAAGTRVPLTVVVHSGVVRQIYNPSTNGASAPAFDPRTGRPSLTQVTVLLVDDEPMVRGLAAHVLRAAGYGVLEAGDGDEGVRVSEDKEVETIDMLITDVVMPSMNGKELANQLLATRPKTRVIYISGYTNDVLSHFDVLGSGWAFIPKPFTPRQLLDTVRRVLSA